MESPRQTSTTGGVNSYSRHRVVGDHSFAPDALICCFGTFQNGSFSAENAGQAGVFLAKSVIKQKLFCVNECPQNVFVSNLHIRFVLLDVRECDF